MAGRSGTQIRSCASASVRAPPYSGAGWTLDLEDKRDRLVEITVADVMTTETIAVAPEAPISEVARLIRKNHIHRVLVVLPGEDGGAEIAGLISLFDLVRLLE